MNTKVISMIMRTLSMFGIDLNKELEKNTDNIVNMILENVSKNVELSDENNQITLNIFIKGGKSYVMLTEVNFDFEIVRKIGVFELQEEAKNLNINQLIKSFK